MKELIHICFTSKDEVLCRCPRDFEIMISRIGHASFQNDTQVLAYAVMSNHVHLVVQTANPSKFVKTLRSSYNQTFNYLYKRQGSLGDPGSFKLTLKGHQHTIDALTYVLQNPVHHKIVENPYDYPYSSMGLYYHSNCPAFFNEADSIHLCKRLVNKNLKLPDVVKYGKSGIVLPTSFVEMRMVENFYGTYNAFQYLSHRKNYYEWAEKQRTEDEFAPKVNLHTVEPLMDNETITHIESSSYRWNKGNKLTDMELCSIIDHSILRRYHKDSYVELNSRERGKIAEMLAKKYRYKISDDQIRRCLAIDVL